MDSMPLMVTSLVRTVTELLTSLIFLYSKLGTYLDLKNPDNIKQIQQTSETFCWQMLALLGFCRSANGESSHSKPCFAWELGHLNHLNAKDISNDDLYVCNSCSSFPGGSAGLSQTLP